LRQWLAHACLLTLCLLAGAEASAETPPAGARPLDWRRADIWSLFWGARWVEGLTLPPRLSLSEATGGVQTRTVYDPDLGFIVATLNQRDLNLAPPRLFTPSSYAEESMRITFDRLWSKEASKPGRSRRGR
jgi:hypothetical protein